MNSLDKYESYAMEKNESRQMNIISACYGLFESIPIKFILSSDGTVYCLD